MLKFVKLCVWALMVLQSLKCSATEHKLENLNGNLTQNKNELLIRNVTLNEKHKLPENEEKAAIEQKPFGGTKLQASLASLKEADLSTNSTNRTGRHLFYSPQFFFIQNYGADGTKCVTSAGMMGVCITFNSCIQKQRFKRQSYGILDIQPWPVQQNFLPYFQQQPEICNFYDQYGRLSYGMCCIDTQFPSAGQKPLSEIPVEESNKPLASDQSFQNPEKNDDDDSEVLEADLSSFQPQSPTYDTTDNTIDYDPIENLKQAALLNEYNNYIRYPWPQQFVGFSGIQQWPPPLPTHPPSIASWPPPVPTHPPNHHYPTHPPTNAGNGGSHFYPDSSSSTTRKPFYASYPTRRTTTSSTAKTTTTTTTTTKRPINEGSFSLGLPLQCGLRNADNPDQERIVGGTNASPHEFPWIAVLFKSGKQFCGGSLITKQHILTAAHCVARMTSWDVAGLTVHLGDYNIRTDFEAKHVTRRIKRLVRHKGFDFSTLHNDIAILTLNEPVQFSKEIQTICLPTSTAQQSRSYSGHIGIVAGWGSLREDGPQPSILQKVQIPIWTNTECAQKYGRAAPAGIISSMICAGQVAKDSCSGDSGGPLIVNDGARYIQVGIVSWGIGCGKGQYPGVYTRVTSLLPWIYKNIK